MQRLKAYMRVDVVGSSCGHLCPHAAATIADYVVLTFSTVLLQ